MVKNYFYLFFFVFVSLHSMEDSLNGSYDSGLPEILVDQTNSIEKVFNKDQKKLNDLLPNEIWLLILDYLNFDENKAAFLQIWVPKIGVRDQNAKKVAIDFYRLFILCSNNLSEWLNKITIIGNNWEDKESVNLVKGYLEILNNSFKDQIKNFETLNDLNYIRDLVIEKYNFFSYEKYKLKFTNHPFLPHQSQFILSLLDIKKNILLYQFKKTFLEIFKLHFKKASFLEKIHLLTPVFFIISLISYLVLDLSGTPANILLSVVIISAIFSICVPYLLKQNKYKFLMGDFLDCENDLKNYIKKNKIYLNSTDNYFLKILEN